jgi:release factor glutamine methyltransferase
VAKVIETPYHCSMTIHQAYQQLLLELYEVYDDREAANIADWVLEHLTEQRKIDRVMHPELPLTPAQQDRLSLVSEKLRRHIPIQYVLNEAWFAGLKLYVDGQVLIPRPETEELVDWIMQEVKPQNSKFKSLIDIGTGSGCIPIALKKKMPELNVRAIDVSEGALNVAIKNAMLQGTQVYFMRMDFLDRHLREGLGRFDIITSNPPYVKQSEAGGMNRNVLDYEPHLALFVPDEDALLFYREIAAFGKGHLTPGGMIFLEINEALGEKVQQLFSAEGYKTELRKDMQGKDRMVKAWRR